MLVVLWTKVTKRAQWWAPVSMVLQLYIPLEGKVFLDSLTDHHLFHLWTNFLSLAVSFMFKGWQCPPLHILNDATAYAGDCICDNISYSLESGVFW